MSPVATIPPTEAQDTADRDATGLRTRWSEELPEGGTRRELLLQALRAGNPTDKDLAEISLVGEELSAIDFSGCNLRGADLSRADLSKAKLVGTDLRDATLFGTMLDGSECLGAQLAGANLSECSAVRAGFGRADLRGALLFQADLSHATLTSAQLSRADLRAAVLEGTRIHDADLSHANLAASRARGAEFDGSDVLGCDFERADLRDCQLRGMQNFDKASWIGVDLRGVDFSGAYLLRRFAMDQNYLFEFRNRNRYHRFVHIVWKLTSDCGRSPVRWLLWNLGLALLFAGLYTMVEVDYGEYPTVLSPFYYSVVTLTTLGYGDVVPASVAAQSLAIIEVLLGYLGLGGLLSILANKMARRAA